MSDEWWNEARQPNYIAAVVPPVPLPKSNEINQWNGGNKHFGSQPQSNQRQTEKHHTPSPPLPAGS